MDLVEYDARIIEQSLELNTTWVPNSSIDRNPPTKSIALPAYPPVFAESRKNPFQWGVELRPMAGSRRFGGSKGPMAGPPFTEAYRSYGPSRTIGLDPEGPVLNEVKHQVWPPLDL